MAHTSEHYDDWIKEQEGKRNWGNLTDKGKAGMLSQAANLADLGKKAFGYSESMRDAFRNQKIDPVKKGRSLESSMSTVDPTKNDKVESESPIFSGEDEEYRKKADKIKKRYG